MGQRVNFYSVFKINNDGSVEPLRTVRIGGVQMTPGVRFNHGVYFGGLDLFQHLGKDLQVEDHDGMLVVTGIY